MSKKNENTAILAALQHKLRYADTSSFESLNGEAPNSCTVLDKNTSLVWKIARNRPVVNPRLELRALELLPDGLGRVAKHVDSGDLQVDGKNYFFLVFPHIEGTSLRVAIKNHIDSGTHFSYQELKRVGDCIAEAICFLNDNNLIHQDIKPDNIIVKSDGSAVLIDLGIALFIEDSAKALKKLEGPYAYMSPEKLSVIGNGKFRQWSKLNFTSDIFSLGLVLLEMATLRKVNGDLEPDLAQLFKIAQIVPGLDVTEEIKSYITPFLLASQFDRQEAVFGATGCRPAQRANEPIFRLWLHSSSKSVNLVDSFLTEHSFKSNFGLIYKAEQASSVKNIAEIGRRGATAIAAGGEFALDPCTYLQVLDEDHHRGTKYFNFAGSLDPSLLVNPPKFVPAGYLDNYVKEVIEAQTGINVTTYISPYLYLDSIEDEKIEANFLMWKSANQYFASQNLQQPKYFGLLISERLILSRQELMELAFMVTNQRYAQNIYLRVESKRPQSQPIWDREYLINLRDFISYLSQTMSVLLASCGLEGIGYINHGLHQVSTNPLFSQRKFSLEDKQSKRGGGTEPAPRYFAKKLMNEVIVPQEVDTLIRADASLGPIFHCDCAFCPNRDKESLAKHFLTQFDEMFSEIVNKLPSADGRAEFRAWLDNANENYAALEHRGAQFSSPTGGSFIPVWKQVF